MATKGVVSSSSSHRGIATSCVCAPGSSHVVTAGKDGVIKIHDLKSSASAPKLINHGNLSLTCVAVSRDYIAVGGEDSKVDLLEYPSGRHVKTLVHFTLPIRHVAFSPDGQWVAVASDEPTIRVVSTSDISDIKVLKGHAKSVRCVAFDPKGDFLVSTSIDGCVRVWDMRDASDSPCVKESRNVLPLAEVDSMDRLSIAWSPDGTKFAVPGRKDVLVIENETWITLFTLSGVHSGAADVVAWSPSGNHVATVDKGNDCQALIWDARTKNVVAKHAAKSRILAFAWEASGQVAAFVDVNGMFTTWKNVVARDSAPKPAKAEPPALKSLFDDEVKESTKTTDSKGSKGVRGLDSDGDDESEEEDDGSPAGVMSDEDGVGDGFVVDDDGAGYAEYGIDIPRKESAMRPGFQRHRFGESGDFGGSSGTFMTSCQKAFQPGSTPMKPGRTTRYLAFNLTGLIYTIDQSTHSTVHVEFHDRSAQRPFSFTDHYNYSMATLGERGALFACESALGSPSRVFYHPFESWATKSEWQAELPSNENIKAIALSTRGAHIATDLNYLRTFSYSGVQTHVMSLPGPIVALCGGPDDMLVIVFTAGPDVAKTHNFGYLLYDVSEMTCIRKDTLPVSPGADLQWIGYSEAGNVATYDSLGIVRSLMPHSDHIWVPMLDSRMAKGDKVESYWPVGLTDKEFMCVIVKGAADPFPTFPNRLISQLPLQAPLLHLSTPSGALEEEYLRKKLLSTHAKGTAVVQGSLADKEAELLVAERDMDKLLLKLILAAVKAEKLQRALDLTMLLNLPRSIDGAVKIAINDHFPGLAERMNLIKEAKLIKNETDEERNRYSRGDDIWACGGHGSTYRERARSPGRPTSRQQHDPLERAMFGNDNESRPARSPPFRERGPEEPATKPVLSERSRTKPADERSKGKSEDARRPTQKFNPFAVTNDAKPVEQAASGASSLLNAMEESERIKEDASTRKRKQQKNTDTGKGNENAPPKKARTIDSMFAKQPRKEEVPPANVSEEPDSGEAGGDLTVIAED